MLHYAAASLLFVLAWNSCTATDLDLRDCLTNTTLLNASDPAMPICRCFRNETNVNKITLFCTGHPGTIIRTVKSDVKILILKGHDGQAASEFLNLHPVWFRDKTYEEIHFSAFTLRNGPSVEPIFGAISNTLLVLKITDCFVETNLAQVPVDVEVDFPPLLWNMAKLQRLHFDRVNLKLGAPSVVLRDLRALTALSISHSTGSFALSEFIRPVAENLQHLDLSMSCFGNPALNVILGNLTDLNLQWQSQDCDHTPYSNWLSSDGAFYRGFQKLSRLSVNGHPLNAKVMEAITTESLSLKRLDLGFTSIDILKEKQFSNLTNLKELSLSQATSAVAASRTFEGPVLDVLNLSGTRFPETLTLGDLLLGLSSKDLVIRDTTLEAMDFSRVAPSLELLDLRNSANLTLSAKMFEGRTKLHTLRISGLPQQNIPADLLDPVKPSLKIMELSHSSVKQLEAKLFENAAALEDVNLAYNQIESFPPVLAILSKISRIDLSNNAIQTLTNDVVDKLSAKLGYLNLKGNPWNCNCDMRALYSWLRDERARQAVCGVPQDCPRCATPLNDANYTTASEDLYKTCAPSTTAAPAGQTPAQPTTATPPVNPVPTTANVASSNSTKAASGNNASAQLCVSSFLIAVFCFVSSVVL